MVQPLPSARNPRLHQPRCLRSLPIVCPVRSQTHDCPINGCKSTNLSGATLHEVNLRRAHMSNTDLHDSFLDWDRPEVQPNSKDLRDGWNVSCPCRGRVRLWRRRNVGRFRRARPR
ncbi:MAG: hypothetical protein EBT09_02935 [Actinobacteria bacterium]|nr:hypothetical protein [Actinomycetota bacterium]